MTALAAAVAWVAIGTAQFLPRFTVPLAVNTAGGRGIRWSLRGVRAVFAARVSPDRVRPDGTGAHGGRW